MHPELGVGYDLWVGGGLSTAPRLAERIGVEAIALCKQQQAEIAARLVAGGEYPAGAGSRSWSAIKVRVSRKQISLISLKDSTVRTNLALAISVLD